MGSECPPKQTRHISLLPGITTGTFSTRHVKKPSLPVAQQQMPLEGLQPHLTRPSASALTRAAISQPSTGQPHDPSGSLRRGSLMEPIKRFAKRLSMRQPSPSSDHMLPKKRPALQPPQEARVRVPPAADEAHSRFSFGMWQRGRFSLQPSAGCQATGQLPPSRHVSTSHEPAAQTQASFVTRLSIRGQTVADKSKVDDEALGRGGRPFYRVQRKRTTQLPVFPPRAPLTPAQRQIDL
ncbi:unnamed protein product, partial [Protopolystoma xenopodis]